MADSSKVPDSLPWASDESSTNYGAWLKTSAGQTLAGFNVAQDAAYAVHAANHYPKLVEALKAIQDARHYDAIQTDAGALDLVIATARAALQEAGEAQ